MRLAPPFPNPSASRTAIAFDLAAPAPIRLGVFDAQGRRVRRLAAGRYGAGHHLLQWDGTAEGGGLLLSGLYFVRLHAGPHVATQAVVRRR